MSIYKPTPSEIVTQAFVEHCCEAYQMDHNGYHGFDHWMRVLYNGRLLAGMEKANLRVIELFCLLHDTQRRNECRDPSHGRRAARFGLAISKQIIEALGSKISTTETQLKGAAFKIEFYF